MSYEVTVLNVHTDFLLCTECHVQNYVHHSQLQHIMEMLSLIVQNQYVIL